MDVTTAIVNFQTPDLLVAAYESFRSFYPNQKVIILDNGSKDNSAEVIAELVANSPDLTKGILLTSNIFHGPAMDLILREHIDSKYSFFLDSDTVTRKAGFLEEMTGFMENDDDLYGIGQVIKINKRGFKDPNGEPVLVTPYMLIRTEAYLDFKPFIHHGQPTIHNFSEARKSGYHIQNYNIDDYIFHHWRGTANRFGYGLGIKGKIDYLLNKLGI